ncbi:MAG: CAP domain-containing protein [Allosphingosinicella sp.]
MYLLGATGLGTNFDSRLLAAHNSERSAAGIAPLHWSDDLAADAADWAETLAEADDLVHAEDEDPDDPQGENLWLGTRRAYTPEEMVGMWIEEKRHFKPGVFPDNSRTGNLEDVGHYTQLMWSDTRRVGCAKSANEENEVLVCRYAAAGNVIGERPF